MGKRQTILLVIVFHKLDQYSCPTQWISNTPEHGAGLHCLGGRLDGAHDGALEHVVGAEARGFAARRSEPNGFLNHGFAQAPRLPGPREFAGSAKSHKRVPRNGSSCAWPTLGRHDFPNIEGGTLLAQLRNVVILHLAKPSHAKPCVGIPEEIGCKEIQLDLEPSARLHPALLALIKPGNPWKLGCSISPYEMKSFVSSYFTLHGLFSWIRGCNERPKSDRNKSP